MDEQVDYKYRTVLAMTIVGTFTSFICGKFHTGYQVGVFNSCQDSVAETLNWGPEKDWYISANTAALSLGALFGSSITGTLANNIGRRKALMTNIYISMLGTLINLIPFTPSFFIGRFIGGITAGIGSTLPPVYVSEISPRKICGKLGSIVQLQLTFGIFVSYAIAIPLPSSDLSTDPMNNWWFAMFAFPAIICAVQFLCFQRFKHDTPRWLSEKGKRVEAQEALKEIYVDWEKHLSHIERLVDDGKSLNDQEGPISNKMSYKTLLVDAGYRKPMLIACVMSGLQQLSGINSFIFYSTHIFQQSGGGADESQLFTAALGFFNMISTLSSLFFVDKVGRKVMFLIGCSGMCASQLSIAAAAYLNSEPWIQLLFMFVFVAFFEASLGSVLWIFIGESTPDKGASAALATNWVFSFLIGLLFPLMVSDEGIGMSGSFFVFSMWCLFGVFFTIFFVKETKGMTPEEVRKKYYYPN